MTPDEAAKAEAESIATRWVPAHMTARPGMVDDIAKALITGRRLVEEAQAELDACKRTIETLGVDLERSDAEVDRLKGERAEARRLLASAPIRRSGMGDRDIIAWTRERDAHLAAPPAEQAQPQEWKEWKEWKAQKHGFTWPIPLPWDSRLTRDELRDAKDRINPLPREPERAEQVQGEAAATLQGTFDRLEQLEGACGKYFSKVAALAKRADALTARFDKMEDVVKHIDLEHAEMCPQHAGLAAPPPPEAAGPLCGKLIGSINAPCTKTRNHGGDCEHDVREAAGPGHVFECSYEPGPHCGDRCICKHCKVRKAIHAVPPIPEGRK